MAKQFFILISLLLCAGIVQANGSAVCGKGNSCPLELLGPDPDIDDSVLCGSDPQRVIYTVQSHVPNDVTFYDIFIEKIIGDDTSSGSTVETVGGSCVTNNNVPAEGACTIEVEITPAGCADKASFPQEIAQRLVVVPNIPQPNMTKDIYVTVLGDEAPSYILISSGEQPTPTGLFSGEAITPQATIAPLLVVHDASGAWKNVAPPTVTGVFNSTTCSGNNDDSVCLAVGRDESKPLLYLSQDGGKNWDVPIIKDFPASGVLYGVACNGDGATASCVAVGETNDTPKLGVILSTTDGGGNWAVSSMGCCSYNLSFYTTSFDNTKYMLTGLSLYNGGLILTSDVTKYFLYNNLLDSACAGGVCAAVGNFDTSTEMNATTHTQPFVTTTKNTWESYTNVTKTDVSGRLNGVSCTVVDGKVVCMAVGLGNDKPYVLVNNDASTTLDGWDVPSALPDFPNQGEALSVSCKTTQISSVPSAVCTVVGYEYPFTVVGYEYPFDGNNASANGPTPYQTMLYRAIYNSSTQQWTWSVNQLSVSNSVFTSTTCTTDDAVICSATGENRSSGAPLLYVNTDVAGAGTWISPITSPSLPKVGCFSNSGSDGSSTGSFYPLIRDSACNYTLPSFSTDAFFGIK